MAWDWTTAGLLEDIRQKAYLPDAHPSFTDTILLNMADRELRDTIMPHILDRREDYYVVYHDFAITANQQRYRLPSRAHFGLLRDASILASDGRLTADLKLASVEQVEYFAAITSDATGIGLYALEGDTVVLLPTPSTTDGSTLRLRYYRRPSKLTAAASGHCVAITAINGNVLTLGASHGFTTSSVCDLVQANPGFDVLDFDQTLSATASTTVTWPTTVPSDLAVGDYVCIANETPVPQVPAEFHSVLAQAVACKVLEQLRDDRLGAAVTKLGRDLEAAAGGITPRNHGAARKIVNRASALRGPRRRFIPFVR